MKSDLAILNAVQYDLGVPLLPMRPSPGSKRKSTATASRVSDAADDPPYLSNAAGDIDDGMESPPSRRRKVPKRAVKVTALSPDSDEGEAEAQKKRARGRPRIDAKDMTATDKRRTQIRLAQRAYRSRKEKAIEVLETKVQSLKEANEAMSNAFMRLHDFTVAKGLLDTHPDLAQQLRQTTEVFLEMAKQSSADEDGDENDDEDDIAIKDGSNSNVATPASAALKPLASQTTRELEKRQRSIADAVMTFGYQTQQDEGSKDRARHPPALSQQIVMPPPRSSSTRTGSLSRQLYGGLILQDSLDLKDGSDRSYGQSGIFPNAFDTASDVPEATAHPLGPGEAPATPFFSNCRCDNMCGVVGNVRGSNGSGSNTCTGNGSAPSSHFFDGPFFSLLPPCTSASPTASTCTSDLAPHLADTDTFISTAAMGSPYTSIYLSDYDLVNISFSLRLRNLAIETGYKLINSPNPPADMLSRTFGFCFMFEPLDQIRRRLRQDLETPLSATNKFSRWELPFVSRVPEPSQDVSTEYPGRTPRSPSGRAPNNMNSDYRGTGVRTVTPRIKVSLPGFEGAFYDCDETEVYLQQRGVHIPPNTKSIIVEVDDADFALANTSTTSNGSVIDGAGASSSDYFSDCSSNGVDKGGINSNIENGSLTSSLASAGLEYLSPDLIGHRAASASAGDPIDWNSSGAPDSIAAAGLNNATTVSDEDAMLSIMGDSMFAPFEAQPLNLSQRRVLALDIDQFLRELVRRSTCLGQTPGFRESDVNEAFWKAARNA